MMHRAASLQQLGYWLLVNKDCDLLIWWFVAAGITACTDVL